MNTTTKVTHVLIDATGIPVLEGDKGMLEFFAKGLENCIIKPVVTTVTIAE